MNYKDLESYQASVVIYDFTVDFCYRYIDRFSRTRDQMNQASRNGKQNIIEASTQRTSKQGELKLLGVARASLQELLEYFLRQRGLKLCNKNSSQTRSVRSLIYQTDKSDQSYKPYLQNPESAANSVIYLNNQANFLLDQQIRALEEKFIKEGVYTENLFKKGLARRDKTDRSNQPDGSY